MIPKDSPKDMLSMRAVVKVSVLQSPGLKPPNNQITLKTIRLSNPPQTNDNFNGKNKSNDHENQTPVPAIKPPNPSCDDLTPLSWLNSLDMGGMVPHLATPPTPPASPPPNSNPPNTFTSNSDRKRKLESQSSNKEGIDYSVDGSVKPPFSYAALIGMAMKSNKNKMTLSAIYKWIRENFVYYKTADPSWQVSCFFIYSY